VSRAVDDLRRLADLTGGPGGARRIAWTDEWLNARALLRELLAELPVDVDMDEAANIWAYLPGESEETVIVGSHLDSVAQGGWLDGALGVMGGLEVLRRVAAEGTPARTLALVDFADEEGQRFSRSLVGSSAVSGAFDPAVFGELRDSDGIRARDVLARYDIDIDRMTEAGGRLANAVAYFELHIEQGPVLERDGVPAAAVSGCMGVERHRAIFTGRGGQAGSPMDGRRDALVAAARATIALQDIARRFDGRGTASTIATQPGSPAAVPFRAAAVFDQRHEDGARLTEMRAEMERMSREAARVEGCEVEFEPIWRIPPTHFDPGLVEIARQAVRDTTGVDRVMVSGALHDAAEVAKRTPAAMLFVPSKNGITHAKEEDTEVEHVELGVDALVLAVTRALAL
jgi:hydantoinase/carbamoylase family amidase